MPLYFLAACLLGMSLTRLSFHDGPPFKSPIILPRQRNTHSETVRAEDRAVTESVARSRALYLRLSLYPALPRTSTLPLSFTAHVPHLSRSRRWDEEECSSQRFPLPAISLPRGFNPSHFLSLFCSSLLLHLSSSSRSHASSVSFHLAK